MRRHDRKHKDPKRFYPRREHGEVTHVSTDGYCTEIYYEDGYVQRCEPRGRVGAWKKHD